MLGNGGARRYLDESSRESGILATSTHQSALSSLFRFARFYFIYFFSPRRVVSPSRARDEIQRDSVFIVGAWRIV